MDVNGNRGLHKMFNFSLQKFFALIRECIFVYAKLKLGTPVVGKICPHTVLSYRKTPNQGRTFLHILENYLVLSYREDLSASGQKNVSYHLVECLHLFWICSRENTPWCTIETVVNFVEWRKIPSVLQLTVTVVADSYVRVALQWCLELPCVTFNSLSQNKKTFRPIPSIMATSRHFVSALFSSGVENGVIYRASLLAFRFLHPPQLMSQFPILELTVAAKPTSGHTHCYRTAVSRVSCRCGLFGMICV